MASSGKNSGEPSGPKPPKRRNKNRFAGPPGIQPTAITANPGELLNKEGNVAQASETVPPPEVEKKQHEALTPLPPEAVGSRRESSAFTEVRHTRLSSSSTPASSTRTGYTPESTQFVSPSSADAHVQDHALGDGSWARSAVNTSLLSAKRKPEIWGSFSIRLAKPTKDRLKERAIRDRKTYRSKKRNYKENHYINAAFMHLPHGIDEAMAMVDSYYNRHGLDLPETKGTTTWISQEVGEAMKNLQDDLTLRSYGTVHILQTVLIDRLLDQLDNDDFPDLDS